MGVLMGRRGRVDGGVILLRDLIREAIGLEGLLEEWGVLQEDPEQKEKDGTSSDPQPTDPNVSDLTIDLIKNPTAAKAKAKRALKSSGGHFEPAGEEVGLSGRQLRRWMYKNIGKEDTLKMAADAGPDPEYDARTGDPRAKEREFGGSPEGRGFMKGKEVKGDRREREK